MSQQTQCEHIDIGKGRLIGLTFKNVSEHCPRLIFGMLTVGLHTVIQVTLLADVRPVYRCIYLLEQILFNMSTFKGTVYVDNLSIVKI